MLSQKLWLAYVVSWLGKQNYIPRPSFVILLQHPCQDSAEKPAPAAAPRPVVAAHWCRARWRPGLPPSVRIRRGKSWQRRANLQLCSMAQVQAMVLQVAGEVTGTAVGAQDSASHERIFFDRACCDM